MAAIEKRISQNGEITFRVKVRLKGFPAQTATFKRVTDAKAWAQRTESAIHEGRYFKVAEAKRHTLEELLSRYQRDILPGKSRSKSFAGQQSAQLNWWKAKLGDYSLADVTPARITEARDELAREKGKGGGKLNPATVNRYMAALSHVFTIAVKEWGWMDDNPMRKVSKAREARGRVRYLSDAERKALLAACESHKNDYLYPIVVLALSTGMRQSEIMRLCWKDIDFERSTITLHETKNGERRVVPLVGKANEILRAKLDAHSSTEAHLFPSKRPTRVRVETTEHIPLFIRGAWQEVVEKAKLKDFRFHDLRHSAASYLAMNGASLTDIAEVLGHKTLQMVKRYAHLSEAHTNKIVAAMNERIFG